MSVEVLDGSLFGVDQKCFGCSVSHPHGMHLKYERTEAGVLTRMTPHDLQQGPPGVMHGGLVTVLADETAAWAIIAATGKFGFTTAFEAKLRSPVKIGLETVAEGKCTTITSRIVKTEVAVSQQGRLCFEGQFTFAILDAAAAEKITGLTLPEEWRRFTRNHGKAKP